MTGSALLKISGQMDFNDYLGAFSIDFDGSFSIYGNVEWNTKVDFTFAGNVGTNKGSPSTGTWQPFNEVLPASQTGIVIGGTTYIEALGLAYP